MAFDVTPEGIVFILLASGQSSRMGQNKLLLPIGNRQTPCVRQVAMVLTGLAPNRVYAVYADAAVKEVLAGLPLETLYNGRAGFGQSESIKLSVGQSWPDNVSAFAFVMGDQPLLSEATLIRLIDAFCHSDANIVVPCVGDQSFSPVIFHRCWTEPLLQLEGDRGAKGLITDKRAKVLRVPFDSAEEFEDMDTPEAYQMLQAHLTLKGNGG